MTQAPTPALTRALSPLEYFAFGFGSMVGVGWLVVMDDWLARGGPAGAMLGFALGGLLLLPVALTYGRLVRDIPDAGAEVAYTEGVFSRRASFGTGWIMVLAYAIVCPWEAVAIGNLLARVFPALNSYPLYAVAGKTIFLPRLAAGLALTALIALVNFRGIRPSGRFQAVTTLGLLACFVVFVALGFARGSARHLEPLFARPGTAGALGSVLLVAQIVPYFMTGFESVAKGSEEAAPGFDPRGFGRAMTRAVLVGAAFYVLIIAAVSFVFPWRNLVAGRLGTETAFARAFGSDAIARLILFAAFLSLLKVFNGNFVAATRLLYAMGRRHLIHPGMARIHPHWGTPAVAIGLLTLFTIAGACLGDALLVPISEVGSLAAGVGWCAACLALIMRARRSSARPSGAGGLRLAALGAIVSAAIVLMKVVPAVPGSFTGAEWVALGGWVVLGLALSGGRWRTVEDGGRR
ncbi:MAG TPA: APC family permease [Gemmatimonadales bacterium]|nr:APC family permease [Gemmatimonadales bacterium]